MEYANYPPSEWEVVKSRVNYHEVAMKDENDQPFLVPALNISATVRPKVVIFERLVANLDLASLERKPKQRPQGKWLAEFGFYDLHFGKLAWHGSSVENYDTKIATQAFRNSLHDTIDDISHKSINRIVFPIGNDFFNVDNWQNTTEKGTPQDQDGRFPEIFEAGFNSCVEAIAKLQEIAPVDVLYVPGNHDPSTSWNLCFCLSKLFPGIVDYDVHKRKFYEWKSVGLMFLHGDCIKASDTGELFATEAPELWGRTKFREAHMGHLHTSMGSKAKYTPPTKGLEYGGSNFRWRRLSSLTGTDKYHYDKGYLNPNACTESFLFEANTGFRQHIYSPRRI